MAKLTSTKVFGDLEVTGNVTINGELLSDLDLQAVEQRVDSLESAGVTTSTSILNLQNRLNSFEGPIELLKTSTHIQWRKEGTSTWNNLIALSELTPSITHLETQVTNTVNQLTADFEVTDTDIEDVLAYINF